MVKKMNLSSITETRIAEESLFNDGIGVVVFLTLLSIKISGVEQITASSVATLFVTEVIGGIALGAIMGYLGLKLLKYIENEHVELEGVGHAIYGVVTAHNLPSFSFATLQY